MFIFYGQTPDAYVRATDKIEPAFKYAVSEDLPLVIRSAEELTIGMLHTLRSLYFLCEQDKRPDLYVEEKASEADVYSCYVISRALEHFK
jgi:hypothetical protein